MRVVWVALLVLVSGCANNLNPTGPGDGGVVEGLTVRGRVLDAESCAMRCEGLANMVVRHETLGITSEPTGDDGAFALRGMPQDTTLDLLAAPAGGEPFAETLNPEVVTTGSEDEFGILLYVLPNGSGSLLSAVDTELGGSGAIHIGQIVRAEGLALVAVEGAMITPEPAGFSVRIVNVLPRLGTGEMALMAPGAPGTGRFGMYVVSSSAGGPSPVSLTVSASGLSFGRRGTTLSSRQPSFAVHQAL